MLIIKSAQIIRWIKWLYKRLIRINCRIKYEELRILLATNFKW